MARILLKSLLITTSLALLMHAAMRGAAAETLGPTDGSSGTCSSCNECSDCSTCNNGASGACASGACVGGMCGAQGSQCRTPEIGNPDLFYNFYVPPTCGGVGAQMYLAPVPVPPVVGHTYYTYQPLMPHEMLYKHHRRYHRYYNEGRGLTRTSVIWW